MTEHRSEAVEVVELPKVVGEHTLIDIPEQVNGIDLDVGAVDAALQQRPKVFDAVRVHASLDVLLGVVDKRVLDFGVAKPAVGLPRVGVDVRVGRVNGLPDEANECAYPAFLDDLGAHGSGLAVLRSDDDRLAICLGTTDLAVTLALPLVPVDGLAADEGLIDFGLARYPVEVAELHGEADAVLHEPSGALLDADGAAKLVGRDSVLGVGDEPDSGEPILQLHRRVLKDGPDLDGELPLARLALPQTPRGQVGVLGAVARRADGSVRPTNVGEELHANVGVIEVLDGLDESAGKRLRAHKVSLRLTAQVSQVLCYPREESSTRVSTGGRTRVRCHGERANVYIRNIGPRSIREHH